MAGLTVLNPIHFLPLASPSSTTTPCSITFELESPTLWDSELLQPLTIGPFSPSTLLSPLSPVRDTEEVTSEESTICDALQRLHDILALTEESSSTQPLVPLDPSQAKAHTDHAIPASASHNLHCLTPPPPPYTMRSPSTSAHRTPFSPYHHRRSPKSTMSFKFAAPAPRIPLASVLQHWATHGSPSQHDPTFGDGMSCVMAMDTDEKETEYEHAGLGLILGAAQVSHYRAQLQPHTQSQCHSFQSHTPSHSQSAHARAKYSRRLRRLAPAPLQLCPTPRQALRALNQTSPPANIPRSPLSSPFVDIPLHTYDATPVFDLGCIPSIDLSAASKSPRTESERRASIASESCAAASISTAPTSLVFPAGPGHEIEIEHDASTRPATHTYTIMTAHTPVDSSTYIKANFHPTPNSSSTLDGPSHLDLLVWRRTVSRTLDAPLSPLRAPKPAKCTARPVSAAMLVSPLSSPLKSATAEIGEFPLLMVAALPMSPNTPAAGRTPTSAGILAPPPLRRTGWVDLPELAHETSVGEVTALSLSGDLRVDLAVEDLQLRAEKCAESIARASWSLRSCSLLKEPWLIADLCENLGHTFRGLQRVLDGTPTEVDIDGSDAKQHWYMKHCEHICSLDKNLNMFYLLSNQAEDRPPRIHKLAGLIDKLTTYQAKFADLARRLSLSHEKLRLLSLRSELTSAHTTARSYAYDGRPRHRRHEERTPQQEGRARRRELREEIRRVRGTMRAMRDRQLELQDENLMVCDDNVSTRWKTG